MTNTQDFYPTLPPKTQQWLKDSGQSRRDIVHEAFYRPLGDLDHFLSRLILSATSGQGTSVRLADELTEEERTHYVAIVKHSEMMIGERFAELRARLGDTARLRDVPVEVEALILDALRAYESSGNGAARVGLAWIAENW